MFGTVYLMVSVLPMVIAGVGSGVDSKLGGIDGATKVEGRMVTSAT